MVASLPSLRGGTVQVPEHAVVQEGYDVDRDECHLLQSSNILLSIISFYPLLSSIIHNKTIYNNPLIQYHIIRKYSLLSRNIHTFPNSYPIHNFPEISTTIQYYPIIQFYPQLSSFIAKVLTTTRSEENQEAPQAWCSSPIGSELDSFYIRSIFVILPHLPWSSIICPCGCQTAKKSIQCTEHKRLEHKARRTSTEMWWLGHSLLSHTLQNNVLF